MEALDFSRGFDFAMGQMGAYLVYSLVMFAVLLIPLVVKIALIWWKGRDDNEST